MTGDCPTCGAEMERNGASGHDGSGRLQEVAWSECPECETVVTDTGEVVTRMDQIHDRAWVEYALATDDWSVIP